MIHHIYKFPVIQSSLALTFYHLLKSLTAELNAASYLLLHMFVQYFLYLLEFLV